MAVEQLLEAAGARQVAFEMRTPRRAALEGQRRIEIVRAFVDPVQQRLARRPFARRFEPLAVFQGHHVPVDRAEEALDLLEQAVVDHAVEALRSEEHTSELQSLMRISIAVFCLKKKT